jgi:hypothetical protein
LGRVGGRRRILNPEIRKFEEGFQWKLLKKKIG